MASLRIAEIFTSLQGEGIWAGAPSLFIRVSGCNLRCVWCDTPYASWNPEGPVMNVEDVLAEAASGPEHVVVTGGEPMLFEATADLCAGLRKQGKTITIETAGTVFRNLECDLMSISPKLANSDPVDTLEWIERHRKIRQDRGAFHKLTQRYACQLKFVVDPDEDLASQIEEIESILVGDHQVLLMAEGIDSETLHRRERLLAPVCVEKGWRLSPRLHVHLFGNTRGT